MNKVENFTRSACFSRENLIEAARALLQVAAIAAAIFTPLALPSKVGEMAIRAGIGLLGPSFITRLFFEKTQTRSPADKPNLSLVRETHYISHKRDFYGFIPDVDVIGIPTEGLESINENKFVFSGAGTATQKLTQGTYYRVQEGKIFEKIESDHYRFAGQDYLLEDGKMFLADRPTLLKDGRLFSNGKLQELSDYTSYRNHSIRPTGKRGEFEDKHLDRYIVKNGELYRKLPEPIYENKDGLITYRETETEVSKGPLFSEKIVTQKEEPKKPEPKRRFEYISTEAGVIKEFEVVGKYVLPPGQLHLIGQNPEDDLTWYTGERWTFPPLWIIDN